MGSDEGIRVPKVVATMTVRLHEDGNMAMEFSGPMASAPVAEHMLKKALQGIDDEKFAAFMKMQQDMSALVKPANGIGSVALGPRRNHG